jgi:ribokinase
MFGAVGDDGFGDRVLAALGDAGVDWAGVVAAGEPTGTAHVVVDGTGGNAIVVVPGANATVTALPPGGERLLAGCQAMLLQLELPLDAVADGAAAARRQGARVVLTPAPAVPLPAGLLADVDLLVPNEHEAAALTGEREPARALAALLGLVPAAAVTLGAAGCLYGERGGEPLHVPALRVAATDTTAAGDAFAGALAVALAEGRPPPAALAWASAAAAVSVRRPGASSSMPSRDEIDAAARSPA